MNLQESIRRILREEKDRVQIRLGRNMYNHFGKVQNIIIQVDNEDITGQDGESGLGKMNIVIKDGEIIVGDIFIPEKYRRQGIATQVYQKISDHFGLPIVNSKTKGFNQTMEGGYMWKDREKFEPRNLQESIRRILREDTDEYRENVRVKISDIQPTNRDGQSIEDAIINVKDGLTSYSQDPPFLLKRGDKYEILDGFHRIAQKILDGKKYVTSDVMIKESIRKVLREDYSPAGKEIIPNKIVIHISNPKFRDRISNEGLKARAGECYKIYAGYGEKCIPAIFATNSTNKKAWFDSTYDDDIWAINTEMIPDVKWYKDRHYESTKKHIVTFNNIPIEAIELLHEGTGGNHMM